MAANTDYKGSSVESSCVGVQVVVVEGVPKIVFVGAAGAAENGMAIDKLVEEGMMATVVEEQKAPQL